MPVKPPAEVELTEDLVRALLAEQHPDLAELPVRLVAQGWDNGVFRLGEDLAVRLPRRETAARLVEHEQQWLAVLSSLSPVPVPAPVRVGIPSALFRWSWSVVPWFAGATAAAQPVADRTAWAGDLASVLAALHVPAPADAPVNPVRGTPLTARAVALTERVDAGHLDAVLPDVPDLRDRARRLWEDALAAPAWDGPALWLHGDPHPANLLVREGRLAALLDFGDVTSGDPASDLATAWLTFDPVGRAVFRDRTDAAGEATGGPCGRTDPGLWRRAAGWALVIGSAMVTHGDDDPVIAPIGAHAIRDLLG
ncbi:MAG TPA: aminoglycoside phosphotransferase family protein [Cellulomonas sp.]